MPAIRLTLFKRGLLLISLPIFFLVLLTILLVYAQAQSSEALWWSNHTKEVIHELELAQLRMTEAHNSTRAYVIIGDDPSIDREAAAASREALAIIAKLPSVVSDNATQQDRVRILTVQAQAFSDWLRDERQMVKEGKTQQAIESIRSRRGIQLRAPYVKSLQDAIAVEESLNHERSNVLTSTRDKQRILLIVGGAVAVVVSGLAVFVFGKGLGTRVAQLSENAGRMAENQPLLPPMVGTDEIALLDNAMHVAADKLAKAAEGEKAFKAELEARAEELGRANESLRQQTQENEMFVYSVSHDLRSPLVNLQGFSKELEHAGVELGEILSDPRVPADVRSKTAMILKADVMDSVRFIQNAVSRSAAIIDALLRLSRAGRIEYRHTRVDLEAVARRVVDAMRSTIEQRQATVVIKDLLPVWGDPTAVDQIFANLIGNAVNYLDAKRPGHVEMGMAHDGRLDENGLRTYYVRDNGLGIPEAHLNKVFVAFQRLHGDVARGEGIGLALVRRIIERHGGRATVESTVGDGTTFFVSLPGEAPAGTPEDKQSLSGDTKDDIARDRIAKKARSYVMSPTATAAAAAEDQAADDASPK